MKTSELIKALEYSLENSGDKEIRFKIFTPTQGRKGLAYIEPFNKERPWEALENFHSKFTDFTIYIEGKKASNFEPAKTPIISYRKIESNLF